MDDNGGARRGNCDRLCEVCRAAMSSPAARLLRFDNFELDTRSGELRKHGVRLRLQGQPLQVLAMLLTRPGDLVTREELREQIWSADTFVDFDHSLHNAIARVRETLGDSAETPRYIETLPRRGYRFIGRVEFIEGNWAGAKNKESQGPAIRALAVLPLEDLSGEPGHEYFADGMTEALITSLAKIKALRVISRTSAMRYKGAKKLLPQIARELNVDAVIEGSVMRSGERVRITAQLIQARNDQHLWAESYEREFRDILTLQSEIARQIANEVRVIVTPEERARLGEARQVRPEAHDLYLKGRYYWNKRSEENVKRALSYFKQAIDSDPTFAQGYTGVADSYNILGYYNTLSPIEAYPKARAAAAKALQLDNTLAEPHAALGVVKRDFEWDWRGSEREFQHAIELNPGYVDAYHWRSTLFSMLGRHAEAVREKTQALAMDPLSVVVRTDLARMLYFFRDYEQALEHYRAAIAMDENFAIAHMGLAQVYEQQNRFEEAITEFKTGLKLSDESPFALAKLGQGYAIAGRREEAAEIASKLEKIAGQRYVSPYDIGMIHLALKHEQALEWLQKAFEDRSVWIGYLNVDPQLDEIRSEPRFQELLQWD